MTERRPTHVDDVLALVELLCDLLGNDARRQITFVADRPGHDFRYALDCAATAPAIGFSPAIPFREGIAATVQWYLDNPEWISTMQAWRGK